MGVLVRRSGSDVRNPSVMYYRLNGDFESYTGICKFKRKETLNYPPFSLSCFYLKFSYLLSTPIDLARIKGSKLFVVFKTQIDYKEVFIWYVFINGFFWKWFFKFFFCTLNKFVLILEKNNTGHFVWFWVLKRLYVCVKDSFKTFLGNKHFRLLRVAIRGEVA